MIIAGAGLAGCEAAYQAAKRGVPVTLIDQKPANFTPAHKNAAFAELVCSNSLKGNALDNACGLLKEEMRRLDSLIIRSADRTAVPAGGALAVDRERFAALVTETVRSLPNVTVRCETLSAIPADDCVIVATGPLTDGALLSDIRRRTGEPLSFYDAAAPLVAFESVDMTRAYFKSRYDKGTPDYINCPMTKEEYDAFYSALIGAEVAPLHEAIDQPNVFEGCMPLEIMARRGYDTLPHGPLKPVGLEDPVSGRRPFAVVQLRRDNREGTIYNLVGFQTNLKFGEQKRVFSMIPALSNAVFLRYGVMHRNTFLCAPRVLDADYSCKEDPSLFFAGQITGVEGYVESAASGLIAGINAARFVRGEKKLVPPPTTAIGSLGHYITTADPSHFQPMNANFGIISHAFGAVRKKKERYAAIAEAALAEADRLAQGEAAQIFP